MIDVLRIAHLRIAPQEGNSEVGNCEVHQNVLMNYVFWLVSVICMYCFKFLIYNR